LLIVALFFVLFLFLGSCGCSLFCWSPCLTQWRQQYVSTKTTSWSIEYSKSTTSASLVSVFLHYSVELAWSLKSFAVMQFWSVDPGALLSIQPALCHLRKMTERFRLPSSDWPWSPPPMWSFRAQTLLPTVLGTHLSFRKLGLVIMLCPI
jgi:hypothetical protein